MAILDLVAEADEPLRFTEILAKSGQPRGTLHRQLSHLVEEGLLDLRRDMTYAPGLRLLSLAARSWARNDFRSIAEPHLRALHDMTGETVHLGALRGNTIVYVDKVEGRQSAVRMYSQIGNASPLYCTGIGKAALSAMKDAPLSELVRQIDFHPFTEATHADASSLLADIAVIRKRGHAFDLEEHESGISCVAAAIASDDLSFIGGVSVTGPAYRVKKSDLEVWAPLVRDAAVGIMRDMNVRLGPRR
ncbi:IclR family transcriptional regulator [Rhizobiaceae bacterium n13]|uniref:IclR family transcriptional regulator n=1 Tax=Ferirhizobium litorale TaxID=2927786 RepID=A0AAE3QE31_9HYPH|nr:IclR family transcriptional regulator [Fererhizobium litorale]MDI7861520.1 IclR family transcriptional regulator [Fererhizobium litorale]MDI7921666.1 IclR family transcriptional regulator [Fererhizobium litorale]